MEAQNDVVFYSDHHQLGFNLNEQEPDQHFTVNKEAMFEKPLTPSDVGKLNRLVIPKQYAEKYFPFAGDGAGGQLLTFEDEAGKLWLFRYSYWNSSQSYVLTKGWSRYVKEKKLDPGDVVLFERDRGDWERMFIGWRRRSGAVAVQDSVVVGGGTQVSGWRSRVVYDAPFGYALPPLPIPYQPGCFHAGRMYENVENYERGNPRQVRLFGVNLDCPDDTEPSTPNGSSQAQGGQPHHQFMTLDFNQTRRHHHHDE